MNHGIKHELDAVATIVAKFLLSFNPEVIFHEEGCIITYEGDNIFLVVSPDGSDGETVIAFEIKCPVPGKRFTNDVHYALLCTTHSGKNEITALLTVVVHMLYIRLFKLAEDIYQLMQYYQGDNSVDISKLLTNNTLKSGKTFVQELVRQAVLSIQL